MTNKNQLIRLGQVAVLFGGVIAFIQGQWTMVGLSIAALVLLETAQDR